ncbi:MAG: hypothetical protein RLZZ440_1764 [Planctomycetota bacterium]
MASAKNVTLPSGFLDIVENGTKRLSNETLVATTTWGNQVGKHQFGYNRFVYGYSFVIPAGKTLKSVTLPSNRNVGILGIALV